MHDVSLQSHHSGIEHVAVEKFAMQSVTDVCHSLDGSLWLTHERGMGVVMTEKLQCFRFVVCYERVQALLLFS